MLLQRLMRKTGPRTFFPPPTLGELVEEVGGPHSLIAALNYQLVLFGKCLPLRQSFQWAGIADGKLFERCPYRLQRKLPGLQRPFHHTQLAQASIVVDNFPRHKTPGQSHIERDLYAECQQTQRSRVQIGIKFAVLMG